MTNNKKTAELLQEMALDDLQAATQYIEDNAISSYFIVVMNENPAEYYIAHNYINSPNHLLSTLELVLLEFKLRFALLPLLETLEQTQGVSQLDIKDMLDNIAKGSKLND